MPTYDYQCLKCASIFEIFHKIGEQPEEGCPICGSCSIKKNVSGFYLGGVKENLGKAVQEDMRADLRENYGIESVDMKSGKFDDLYKGIKKDGSRVKEQMLAGQEKENARIAKKNREFLSRPTTNHKSIDKIIQKQSKGAIRKG